MPIKPVVITRPSKLMDPTIPKIFLVLRTEHEYEDIEDDEVSDYPGQEQRWIGSASQVLIAFSNKEDAQEWAKQYQQSDKLSFPAYPGYRPEHPPVSLEIREVEYRSHL